MDIRALAEPDMAVVAKLCERELVLDRAAGTLPAVLARRPAIALVATSADGLPAGVCFGSVAESHTESPAGFLDLFVVDRSYQRRGLGRKLVAEMERQLASRGCQRVLIAGNGPFYAWPGIDIRYTAAVCFAEDLGYQRRECEVNMDVDLLAISLDAREDVERLRAAGIEVRSASAADKEPLLESLAAVWQPEWIAEVAAALRTEGAGLQVALAGSDCVGFCAYGVRRLHEVGPLGTSPSARGQGIASVLLRRSLTELGRRGVSTAELVWAGPLSYFSRILRATIGRAFWIYEKDLTRRELPPDWRDRIGLL